ncbi:MAG: hypothetical protein R6X17_12285 [Candidatus Competibacteraceae bacterium]|jgi:molybdopterin-guanine dinucleotide biosynthesis protein A
MTRPLAAVGCWYIPHLRDKAPLIFKAQLVGVGRWLHRHRPVRVEFTDDAALFRNANTPEDLGRLDADWSRG